MPGNAASAEQLPRAGELSVECIFDFDGCIDAFCGKGIPHGLNTADRVFWFELRAEMFSATAGLPNDRRCVSIGTARQSKGCDLAGMTLNDSPSCYPLYEEIALFLHAEIDNFLLADVKGHLEPGTSYNRILNENYTGEHAGWYFDRSKISLIYAKAHRAATCNPNGTVRLNFYDDRHDILTVLKDFFTENPNLLPDNAVLNLAQYQPGFTSAVHYAQIYGIGQRNSLGIDYDYLNTVEQLGRFIYEFAWSRTPVTSRGMQHLEIPDFADIDLAARIREIRAPVATLSHQLSRVRFSLPENAAAAEDVDDNDRGSPTVYEF